MSLLCIAHDLYTITLLQVALVTGQFIHSFLSCYWSKMQIINPYPKSINTHIIWPLNPHDIISTDYKFCFHRNVIGWKRSNFWSDIVWMYILYFSFALIEIVIGWLRCNFWSDTFLIWISCLNFALIEMWLVVRGAILGSFWGCVLYLNFALIEICFKLIFCF